MFVDLSWAHMLLVLVVALVVVGPKDLPKLMHTMGRWAGKARAMADQFRKSFDEMARQSELDELRKEIEELRNQRPLSDVEQELMKPLPPEHVVLADMPNTAQPVVPPYEIPEPVQSEPSEPIEEGKAAE